MDKESFDKLVNDILFEIAAKINQGCRYSCVAKDNYHMTFGDVYVTCKQNNIEVAGIHTSFKYKINENESRLVQYIFESLEKREHLATNGDALSKLYEQLKNS